MTTKRFQLLNEKLEVVKQFDSRGELLDYTDTLPLFGRGLIIYNTRSEKSVQLV